MCSTGSEAMPSPNRTPSPRLRSILSSLGVPASSLVLNCVDAASMDPDCFGDKTEDVRACALHSLMASRAWRGMSCSPPAAAASSVASHELALSAGPQFASTSTSTSTVACTDRVAACIAAGSQSTVGYPSDSPSQPSANGAAFARHSPPSASAAAATAATQCATLAPRVLAPEVSAIEAAVSEFLSAVPNELLLHQDSALPAQERIAARRRHLLQCGVGSIRAGTAFVRSWISFCNRKNILNYGMPIDSDVFNAFLAEVDSEARRRALGRTKQTGASVQHATACAARWVSDHAGLPFEAAKSTLVRKSAGPAREAEPSWSTMWEVAVFIQLLRTAIDKGRSPLVRATAAAAYLVCGASLRLVNGLRSAPPTLDRHLVFHGIAALSKGRRRSSMHPKPWSMPCTSPDPSLSDSEVAHGLLDALHQLPTNCCSMFPRLVNAEGKEVGAERAIAADPTARASDAQLVTSITYVLTLPPLSLSRAEARSIASHKHGPRHLLPEVGRVLGLPAPARHELGMWAGVTKGRGAMANRYARDAERLLSRQLRSIVLCHIRSRVNGVNRITLAHLTASPQEMQTAFAAATASLQAADLHTMVPEDNASMLLGCHSAGGGALGTDGTSNTSDTLQLAEPPALA